MKLEQQVTSLEISKQLKRLGVKQDSIFNWYDVTRWETGEKAIIVAHSYELKDNYPQFEKPKIKYSAFTVAELGKILPWEIDNYLLHTIKCSNSNWIVYYEKNKLGFLSKNETRIQDQIGDTEADTRGKMLIYLIKNKLI